MNKPTIKASRGKEKSMGVCTQIANIYAMCVCTGTLCLRCDCALRIRISFDLFSAVVIVAIVVVAAIVDSIKYSETDDI